jgi:hypothetical protein
MMLKKHDPLAMALAAAFLTLYGTAHAQEDVRFEAENLAEQLLAYTPVQREGVSDEDFSRGVFFLDQTKSAVDNNADNFLAPDYWNVSVAFMNLGEPNAHIALAFQAAIEADPDAICDYLDHMGGGGFERVIPDVVTPFQASCTARSVSNDEFDIERYIADNGLDPELVREVAAILADDQRHRSPLGDRQAALDAANQDRIDALFAEHGTYIGQTLVGEELDYVMFLVIQHSNLDYMERYLPQVQAAVHSGELGAATPLKMLLDRIYWLREGYQVFGSQGSVPLADEATRRAIIETYQVPESD